MDYDDYIFRELRKDEVPFIFEMILSRIRWMDAQGIRSWNTTDYVNRFPLSYFEKKQLRHEVFALTDRKTDRLLCAAVLKQEDERWNDTEPALYVHNLVADSLVRGAGAAFLHFAGEYARSMGKNLLRLDSIEGNPAINSYYEKQGFRAVGQCTDGVYHGILREKTL